MLIDMQNRFGFLYYYRWSTNICKLCLKQPTMTLSSVLQHCSSVTSFPQYFSENSNETYFRDGAG